MSQSKQSPLLSKIHLGLSEAFRRAKKESDIDGDLVLLSEDRFADAMDFLRIHYMTEEPCSKAGGQQFTADLKRDWFLEPFSYGLSVLVLKPGTQFIIGIQVIDIAARGGEFSVNNITDASLMQTKALQNYVTAPTDVFSMYGVEELVRFQHMSVHKEYRKVGIATKLLTFCMKVLRYLTITPLYAKVHCSSEYSRKVFEKLGFESLNSVDYREYRVDGKVVYPAMGEHTSFVFLAVKIA